MASDDDLLRYRDQFPGLEDAVYMVSHSMGCMPARARDDLRAFCDAWEKKGVDCWDDWLPEVEAAGNRIARLLSAPEGTVCMQQNVSTAMAVVASCLEYTPERNKVVYSSLNFPSVSYVWKAEERRGAKVHIVESEDGVTVDTQAMLDAIDEHTVCVPISHVIFRSSYLQDAAAICRKARAVGAHVILDCYQSVGCMPVDIVDLGASFACGGSHKWLCGAGGAAYLYVRSDLIDQFEPRITGWFASDSPFAFSFPAQSYAEGIWRYMNGTMAVAAYYQSRAGQEIVAEIGQHRIREKSQRQTQRIVELVDERDFKLNSPRDPEQRGGAIIFDFVGAADVARELARRRFFCDHRPGVGIRVGPHFYTTDDEIERFFAELDVIRKGA